MSPGDKGTEYTVRRAVADYINSFQAQSRTERIHASSAAVRGAWRATNVAVSFDDDCLTSPQSDGQCHIARLGELSASLSRQFRYVFAALKAGVNAGSFGKAIAFLAELDGHFPNEPWQEHVRDPNPPSPLTLTRWLAAHSPQRPALSLNQMGKASKPTPPTQWWDAAGRERSAK